MSRSLRSLAAAAGVAAVIAAAPAAASAEGTSDVTPLPGGGWKVCAAWEGWHSCATVTWADGLKVGAAAGGYDVGSEAGAGVDDDGNASAGAGANAGPYDVGAYAGASPTDVRTVSVDPDSATVTWDAPKDANAVAGYHVALSDGTVLDTSGKSWSFDDLEPGKVYVAAIAANLEDGSVAAPEVLSFATPTE